MKNVCVDCLMALMNWPRGMGAVIGDDASTTSMLMAAFPSSGACRGGCCRVVAVYPRGGLPLPFLACGGLPPFVCHSRRHPVLTLQRILPGSRFLACNDPACADVEVQAKILKIVAAVCIYSPVGYNHAVAAFEAHAVHTCRPRFQVCWGGA